jgi:hypothetical protein
MNTCVGAAETGVATQRVQKNFSAEAHKRAVDDSRSVDGVTVASTRTPRLTTWLSAGCDGEARVESVRPVDHKHDNEDSKNIGKYYGSQRILGVDGDKRP